jgi:hypothetical protein
MMRSTPAAQARARTAGMSAEWHCFPWYIPLNMPSSQQQQHKDTRHKEDGQTISDSPRTN